MMCLRHLNNMNQIVEFKSVGVNNASTFTGLCSIHDSNIFNRIDNCNININNPSHLFLLAYRSVLRELHAVSLGAAKIQSAYQKGIRLGLWRGDTYSTQGMQAVSHLVNAYYCYLYKKSYDDAFLNRRYNEIKHMVILLKNAEPSIAVSALYSLDDFQTTNDVVRVALNIFPRNGDYIIIFSYLARDERYIDSYLDTISSKKGKAQKDLISWIVLQHCENFVMSPEYFNQLSKNKRENMITLFADTILLNKEYYANAAICLFT